MRLDKIHIILGLSLILFSCQPPVDKKTEEEITKPDPVVGPSVDPAPAIPEKKYLAPTVTIDTKQHSPDEILSFARTLQGVPYLFASTDPEKGFDCSGFITYVFNHFNIAVPRSSVEFTNQGKEVDINDSRPGDLILFTGTDSSVRVVGHMGMVESRRNDSLFFIHSSSGKANGVVITPFQKYYQGRFVKVIRVFPEEYFE